MHHPILSGILVGFAVALAILCSVGLLAMRDAYQRLHFTAPVVSISIALIATAVWIEETDIQARIKVVLIALVLFFTNSILTHATARAFRIRQAGHWRISPKEHIPIIGRDEATGAGDEPPEDHP